MSKWEILRTEVNTDPTGAGYSGMTDKEVANSLNDPKHSLGRTAVPGGELLEAIKPADLLTLNDAQRWALGIIFGLGSVNLDNANIRTIFTSTFAGKTETLAALGALQTKAASRAEVIGFGEKVLEGYVKRVRI